MGVIYLITNKVDNKQYVGQTSRTLEERFAEHKDGAAHYKRVLEQPNKYSYKGTCTYLYRSMNLHGIDNFRIESVVECSDDELDDNEKYFIVEYNTLSPSGYNLTTGGGHFHHCDETKKIISKKVKATMLSDIDRFRSSDKTIGMPPYTAYKNDGMYESYYTNNHPLCPTNTSFSVSKYGSIESAKAECIKFVNELNTSGKMYTPPGPNGARIKGLRPLSNGYQVRKVIKGRVVEKSFNEKEFTKEQNEQRAIDYINSLK